MEIPADRPRDVTLTDVVDTDRGVTIPQHCSLPSPEVETADAARFAELFDRTHSRVLLYALRRVNNAEDAADVVGDTYLAAWRRMDEVPDGEPALFWLFATARRATANHRRGERRRDALTDRLREDLLTHARDHPARPESVVAKALRELSDEDQELLRLDAWEQLPPRDIAVVLGLSSGACRVRLHRARRRLAAQIDRPTHSHPAAVRELPADDSRTTS